VRFRQFQWSLKGYEEVKQMLLIVPFGLTAKEQYTPNGLRMERVVPVK
jgi:hypothetical protein